MQNLLTLEQRYIEACQSYNIGEPIISDSEFDTLERTLRDMGSALVNKLNESVESLDRHEESNSLFPLNNWEDILNFIREFSSKDFIFTLKYDGVQAKITTGEFFEALSRSNVNSISYTDALRDMFSHISHQLMVAGEVLVTNTALNYFRGKKQSNIKYASARSTALSLLRSIDLYTDEERRLLTFKPFKTTKFFETHSEELDYFRTINLDAPKYIVSNFTGKSDELIIQEIQSIMSELDDENYESDGIVMELNNFSILPTKNHKYLNTQVALKLDRWGTSLHQAIVKELLIEPSKGTFGITFGIQPVYIGKTEITSIYAFNIGRVLDAKIEAGSIINFERQSNGMCVWVLDKTRGDKNE